MISQERIYHNTQVVLLCHGSRESSSIFGKGQDVWVSAFSPNGLGYSHVSLVFPYTWLWICIHGLFPSNSIQHILLRFPVIAFQIHHKPDQDKDKWIASTHLDSETKYFSLSFSTMLLSKVEKLGDPGRHLSFSFPVLVSPRHIHSWVKTKSICCAWHLLILF